MSLSSVVASLAITLSGLTTPVPAPSLPAAIAMAPSQPATIIDSEDGGGGVTALPDLPGCPSGQGYGELCLLESQKKAILLRLAAIDDFAAGVAAITAGMEAMIAEAETPAEVAQIILQAQLAIAAETVAFALENAAINEAYLANAANCCEPGGLDGGSGVGLADLGEFPKIVCPDGVKPDPSCVAAYEAESAEFFQARLAEMFTRFDQLGPEESANEEVLLLIYWEFIYDVEGKMYDLEAEAILHCCDK